MILDKVLVNEIFFELITESTEDTEEEKKEV